MEQAIAQITPNAKNAVPIVLDSVIEIAHLSSCLNGRVKFIKRISEHKVLAVYPHPSESGSEMLPDFAAFPSGGNEKWADVVIRPYAAGCTRRGHWRSVTPGGRNMAPLCKGSWQKS